MLLLFIKRMSTHDAPTFRFQSLGQDALHFGLFGPAFLIGRQPQIPIGHEIGLLRLESSWWVHSLGPRTLLNHTGPARASADGRPSPEPQRGRSHDWFASDSHVLRHDKRRAIVAGQ